MRAFVVLGLVACGCVCADARAAPKGSSPAACAVAWNAGASSALRHKIAAAHPRGAFIGDGVSSTMTITWSKGTPAQETHGTGCSIQFILAGGATQTVFGSWKGSVITIWNGPIPSNRPIPVPDNTTVHPDGTVGYHG